MDDTLFSAAVLEKLPLADSVWRLLHFTMADSWLEDLWDRTRGRCNERILQFSTLAHLIAEALLQHGGSGHQAFERAKEDGRLPVSIGSAFEKLGNLPVPLSDAFLGEGSRRLQATLPADPTIEPLADCWAGHDVFAIDGKVIKHVKRLLKPLRNLQAGILGARAAVALNLRTGMAVAMVGHLDGEAGEGPLAEELLPKMAAAAGERPWVVVLDRLFCNLTFPPRVLKAGGHFVARYNSHTAFYADETRPAQEFHDAQGRRVVQEWGWLGGAKDPRRLSVRRITLWLPDGKQVISVVTDLLDEKRYPAIDLLAMYKNRWGIERVFHQITDVFSLKKLIGTTPQATLFQLSFCLLLYNTLQVVRAHLASHQKCKAEKISNEKLFYDVKRQLVASNELIKVDRLLGMLGQVPTASDLRVYLRDCLQSTWSQRWWKAGSSHGGGHQKVKIRVLGNHTSTFRVLQQQQEQDKKQREQDKRTSKPSRRP
jgi:hypothetical protein